MSIIERNLEQDESVSRFFDRVCNLNPINKIEDYTFIILGEIGPSGKTWLCNQLKGRGFKAFEISGDVFRYIVDYLDGKNHYIVDEEQKCIVCIINRIIRAKY